ARQYDDQKSGGKLDENGSLPQTGRYIISKQQSMYRSGYKISADPGHRHIREDLSKQLQLAALHGAGQPEQYLLHRFLIRNQDSMGEGRSQRPDGRPGQSDLHGCQSIPSDGAEGIDGHSAESGAQEGEPNVFAQ